MRHGVVQDYPNLHLENKEFLPGEGNVRTTNISEHVKDRKEDESITEEKTEIITRRK